ncbi:UvrD-helicase domain-containing protein [Tepidibacillus marianensis]|uniref:UvrD-helicase domain-containing protein n=1 Tax=Tepidibacillus marianensis TaxID=3131995 RepID=UPI0030D58DA5
MPFPLTDEQAYAVDTLDINCIVPAGAGSGKTRVLVERFVKIIEKLQNVPFVLEKIVAITFTEKAAREMKERVRKEMMERRDQALIDQVFNKAELWQENIQRLERANISTIHSFCAKILREFPIEAKLDPEFQVLDQTQMNWLLFDVVENELKKQLEVEKEKGASPLYQWVIAAGFRRAVKQIVKGYQQLKNTGHSLKEIRQFTENQFQKSPYEWLIGWEQLIQAGESLYHADSSQGNKNFKEFQNLWVTLREGLIQAKREIKPLEPIVETLINVTKGNLGKEEVKEWRTKVNNQAKKLMEQLEGIKYLEWEKTVLELFYPLFERIDQRILLEKERLNGLDFDDLQLQVVHLLKENQRVKQKLQKRYTYFMIDEFQDNNQVQKTLASLLLTDDQGRIKPGRLFVVGDPKQSIYRFRGADVSVFKEMEQVIVAMNGRVAPLQFNFRSHPQIIEFVNAFFRQIMSKDPLSPNYYENAIARGQIESKENPIEFIPIYDDKEDEESVREKEAMAIAMRIEQLMSQGVQAGEVAVLLRAMSNIKIYEHALRKFGIPYYVMGGRGFYEKQEIHDLIHILKYLIDSSNKIALAGILRSPIVGIQDDTLYWLMTRFAHQDLFRWSSQLDGVAESEQKKIKHFLDWFESTKNWAGRMKVADLLRYILKQTHYTAILFGLNQDAQAVANIEKFIRMAENFPSDNPYSIHEFLARFERLIEEENKETEAAIESEMGNIVKLMTIHQSKGLEFPYVFVPDLSRKPNHDDALIQFHSSFGLTCKVPSEDHTFVPSIRYQVCAEKEKELDREESARVLYVAITRAEKKLFLSGKVEEAKNKEDLGQVLKETTWSKWLDAVFHVDQITIEEGQWPYLLSDGRTATIQVMNQHLLEIDNVEENRSDVDQEDEQIGDEIEQASQSERIDYTKPIQLAPEERRISVSAIKRYQQCPRYYYFTDRLSLYQAMDWFIEDADQSLGMEDEKEEVYAFFEDETVIQQVSLTPSLKGTIVHYVLEQITLFPNQIDEWQGTAEVGLVKQGHDLGQVVQKDWNSFLLQLEQYVMDYKRSSLFQTQADEVWPEYDFVLPLSQGKIFGTIDRIELYSDGSFSIVDYKTDQQIDIDLYRPQILTYALAIQKRLSKKAKDGKLYYLRHNKIESVEINQDQLSDWEKQLETLLEKINHSQHMDDFPKNEKQCFHCSFQSLCIRVT